MWTKAKATFMWFVRTTNKVLQIRSGNWDANANPPLDDKHFRPGPPEYRP